MVKTRSDFQPLFDLDPEIERSFLQHQRDNRMATEENDRTAEQIALADTQRQLAELQLVVNAQRALMEAQQAANAQQNPARTLRERTMPNLTNQPQAVIVPTLAQGVTFELKTEIINLLPTFHGLSNEDPIMHLNEFHDLCMRTKPVNVTEEQIKMRAFRFTLKDAARSW